MAKWTCSAALLLLLAVGTARADDTTCTSCEWIVRIMGDALCDYELMGRVVMAVGPLHDSGKGFSISGS
jgi:hypothetical protein